jgi:hypothetical protein
MNLTRFLHASGPTEPKSLVGKVSRVDHRDGAGHLEPAYKARLEGRTARLSRTAKERAFVGDPWAVDSMAERSAEEFVMTVTSGEDAGADMLGAVTPEENGGPFVETSAAMEFAYGTDPSNLIG